MRSEIQSFGEFPGYDEWEHQIARALAAETVHFRGSLNLGHEYRRTRLALRFFSTYFFFVLSHRFSVPVAVRFGSQECAATSSYTVRLACSPLCTS